MKRNHLSNTELTKSFFIESFMGKKTSSVKNSVPAGFSWAKDSGFTPPKKGEGTPAYKTTAPSAPQSGDLKPLLEKLLGSLIVAVNASAGIIRTLTPHGQTLQLICSVGLPAELLEAESEAHLNCEADRKASNGSGLYSVNLTACKSRQDCHYAGCQIQSLIATQIESQTTPKDPVGMLTLFFNEIQEPAEHTSKAVLAFAQMLSAVIEHDKSNRDAKRVDLIAERQAIANEIHDSLAQTLVYTRMRTSSLLESIRSGNELMAGKYAHDVDEALEISQKTVRELITDFRCAMDPAGLLHALQNLTRQFSQRNDISLEYINRLANLELPLEYEIQAYHIVQEALANITTHSGATHARLIVEHTGNYYVFIIDDNGSGGCTFTPVEGHYGMMIMRERAQRINGEIRVESSKGIGTRVQLFFPEPGVNWREVNE
jgi:two-component system, NarL family, nitrate/nitrite sensor histidine kinase NarX